MSRSAALPFAQPLTLVRSEHCLAVLSDAPLRTLSSALVGGGLGERCHFANFHVDNGYDSHTPKADLTRWLAAQQLSPTAVAMMTAVQLHNACIVSVALDKTPHGVMALVTAGVGNAVDISFSREADSRLALRTAPTPGTINTFLFVAAHLTDAAFVNASLSATEAKVQALSARGVNDPYSGTPATGTSTDSLAIAATQRGNATPYAGSGTEVGRAIGEAVYRATLGALANSHKTSSHQANSDKEPQCLG